jgi:hypothetical protein
MQCSFTRGRYLKKLEIIVYFHSNTFKRSTYLFFQEDKPFLFFVKDVEISSTLKDALDINKLNSEEVVEIIYQQQAVFRVRPVTRCTRFL